MTKHQLFYKAYHALREHFPDLQLSGMMADELDSLIWSALGYAEPFQLRNTHDLTEHDCQRLKLLCGVHGFTIFKMMLARRADDNRAYMETANCGR